MACCLLGVGIFISMPSYTKQQLKDRVTASANITGASTFTLFNDSLYSTYFTIEGTKYHYSSSTYEGPTYRQIFNSASITSLISCSVVVEPTHAAFVVEPSSTASFIFTPTTTIPSTHIDFIATNTLIYNIEDPTSSGSYFGISLSY